MSDDFSAGEPASADGLRVVEGSLLSIRIHSGYTLDLGLMTELRRATTIAAVDVEDEVAAAEAWFSRWRARLTYCSENKGCGCCIAMWDVEGPAEATAEIPCVISAMSEWSETALAKLQAPERTERPPRRGQKATGEVQVSTINGGISTQRHEQNQGWDPDFAGSFPARRTSRRASVLFPDYGFRRIFSIALPFASSSISLSR